VRRGDLVTIALKGDAGKPRPALVVQEDALFEHLPTIVVVPLTSSLADFPLTRVTIGPDGANGLRVTSQAMVSRPQSVLRERLGARIGRADEAVMREVNRKLSVLLGLAG
jgi:mRNA interferase MazF